MLVLPRELEAQIRAAALARYPDECCGILIGEIDDAGTKTVRRAEEISNAREDGEKYHRFLITPEEMLRALESARAARLEVVGFYHSHPDHPAIPSDFDREHALPFYSYVIVSVQKGKAAEITSWELSADRSIFSAEIVIREDE